MTEEEKAKRALEEREKAEGATFDESSEKTSLGKVETKEQKEIKQRDLDLKERVDISADLNVKIGYTVIPTEDLPSRGRFYPENISIQYRSASGREIEHWSTMNEEDPIEIDSHFRDIIKSCVNIKSGARPLQFGELLEADKLFILLKIQEKTFDEGENKINLDIECGECGTKNKKVLSSSILDASSQSSDKLEEYYDTENRRYTVLTKSFGEIHLYPPTIGTMKFVFDYVREKTSKKQYFNKALMQVLPYLVDDYKDLTEKDIKNAEIDFTSWDKKKISLIYRLVEMIKVGIKPSIQYKCSNCGSLEETPVGFPEGPKALFLISDIEDELI